MKRLIKRMLLRRKNIKIDRVSNINFGVKNNPDGKEDVIVDSQLKLEKMGYGCFLEHVYCYGKIELGNYVSISGPGTILHSEIGIIRIGSFSSLAENVSIQEFNHKMNRVTSASIGSQVWDEDIREDFVSKGDITIEEDVWVGSNVSILSGVTIGRGSVIGAGAVITKSVPRYSVVVGNPGSVIRKRFTDEKIRFLESLIWWEWDEKTIKKNKAFFQADISGMDVAEIQNLLYSEEK